MISAAQLQYTTSHSKIFSKMSKNSILTKNPTTHERLKMKNRFQKSALLLLQMRLRHIQQYDHR